MDDQQHIFRFSLETLLVPFLFVLSIWLVFWVEIRFGFDFTRFGVYPRTFSGLKGVLLSPFIHGSAQHLYNNTLPLFILLTVLLSFYKSLGYKVIVYGIVLSGLLTWIIGRGSYHIGASGLIYVLTSFIFFKGIIARHFRLIALSLMVIFLYGSFIWYLFPIEDEISWEGHSAGFIAGLALAVVLKKDIPKPPKYIWEDDAFDENSDPFLKHFDEDGNFISSAEREQIESKEDETL